MVLWPGTREGRVSQGHVEADGELVPLVGMGVGEQALCAVGSGTFFYMAVICD